MNFECFPLHRFLKVKLTFDDVWALVYADDDQLGTVTNARHIPVEGEFDCWLKLQDISNNSRILTYNGSVELRGVTADIVVHVAPTLDTISGGENKRYTWVRELSASGGVITEYTEYGDATIVIRPSSRATLPKVHYMFQPVADNWNLDSEFIVDTENGEEVEVYQTDKFAAKNWGNSVIYSPHMFKKTDGQEREMWLVYGSGGGSVRSFIIGMKCVKQEISEVSISYEFTGNTVTFPPATLNDYGVQEYIDGLNGFRLGCYETAQWSVNAVMQRRLMVNSPGVGNIVINNYLIGRRTYSITLGGARVVNRNPEGGYYNISNCAVDVTLEPMSHQEMQDWVTTYPTNTSSNMWSTGVLWFPELLAPHLNLTYGSITDPNYPQINEAGEFVNFLSMTANSVDVSCQVRFINDDAEWLNAATANSRINNDCLLRYKAIRDQRFYVPNDAIEFECKQPYYGPNFGNYNNSTRCESRTGKITMTLLASYT